MKTLVATLILFFVSFQAQAIKVTAVKNGKALLDLEGESVKTNERYLAISEEGKKKGLLTIHQVKGNKAIAVIDKGSAQVGYVLEPYEARSAHHRSRDKASWGLMGGYSMNSMDVKPTGGSVSLAGSSFELTGFYSMVLDKNISAKFSGGYKTLVANGTASSALCGNGTSTNCDVNISYLGIDALLRYTVWQNKTFDVWGGAGLGFLFALSKSSNVLDTSKITTNQTIEVALGADYNLNAQNYIPFQFTYALFPNNSTSSANQMIFSVGYGWNF